MRITQGSQCVRHDTLLPMNGSRPSKQIAHVNLASSFRGGERQTELLVRDLVGTGFTPIVVARAGGELARRLDGSGIEVRESAGNPLAAALAAYDVDLVHVHDGRSVYAAWLRSLMSGTPYVVTRRVNNPIGTHWLAHRAYRTAACVVGVSQDIADIVERYDPQVRRGVIRSASSGLSVDEARSARIRARWPDRFLVGHVGALDNRQKGQEYIIEVARGFEKSRPEIQFLLVGGGGDEGMLRSLASGLTNLEFEGFVDNVGDYLAAFDIFVMPSNYEGIGGILLDAMDRSLPVIASDVGGVREIVHDGENGFLIEAARPDQLAAAIIELQASPALRARFGERGREIAANHTAASMCRSYIELYRCLLGVDSES